MSAVDRLDEIQARADNATDGPWEAPETTLGLTNTTVFGPGMSHTLYHSRDHETANFVAHARTDVPALVAALRGVLNLHRETSYPYDMGYCEGCNQAQEFPEDYPCPTVRAVEAALGGAS